MSLGWGIMHALNQRGLRCACKFISGISVRSAVHRFENLKQTPTLALITFRVEHAFPFEVHIIDQGITSLWSSRQTLELLLYVRAIGGRSFGEHFWERALQPGHEEFGLKVDRAGEKLAQLVHVWGVLRSKKLRARVPGTWLVGTFQE
jgi:hypothetical protein